MTVTAAIHAALADIPHAEALGPFGEHRIAVGDQVIVWRISGNGYNVSTHDAADRPLDSFDFLGLDKDKTDGTLVALVVALAREFDRLGREPVSGLSPSTGRVSP